MVVGLSYRKANRESKANSYGSSILLSLRKSAQGPLFKTYPLRSLSFDDTYATAINALADHLEVDDLMRMAMHDSVKAYKWHYGIQCEKRVEKTEYVSFTLTKNPNVESPGYPVHLRSMYSEAFLDKIFRPDGSLLRVSFLPTSETERSIRPAGVYFAWPSARGRQATSIHVKIGRDIPGCYSEIIDFICKLHDIEVGSDLHAAMVNTQDHFIVSNGIERVVRTAVDEYWLTTSAEERRGLSLHSGPKM